MIWKYWPISQLQQNIGEDDLTKIGEILPLIDNDGSSIFFETNKTSLVKLMAAFAAEDYFKTATNLEKCLNYLPPEKLDEFLSEVDYSLAKTNLKKIVSKILKSENDYISFIRFFNIPERFFPATIETKKGSFVSYAPSKINPIKITTPYKVLKNYQANIFYRSMTELDPPMSRIILQMPTGSGKTRTTMEIISHYLNSSQTEDNRIVWLANSRELCEQAVSSFVDVWQHVGRSDVEVLRVWGKFKKPDHSLFSTHKQFLVCSLQTLWKLVKSGDKQYQDVFGNTSLLVIDEAHIAVADTYVQVVRDISKYSRCRIVGLTATPGRTIEEETGKLSDLFHSKIVSLKPPATEGGQENTIAYLRSIGVLSSVNYESLIVDSGTKLSKNDIKRLESELDYSKILLKKIGQSMVRSAEIISKLIPYLKSNEKVLLFAPSVENSKFLTSMLTFLGYGAVHIDGNTPELSRDRFIDDFVNGELQILCNYGVLATGFDAPKVSVLCIARPTTSPVLYSQMIGRGLRGPIVGGTSSCTIIEVKDNFLNQGTQDELYDHFSEYWND